jgi:hypothetical protein
MGYAASAQVLYCRHQAARAAPCRRRQPTCLTICGHGSAQRLLRLLAATAPNLLFLVFRRAPGAHLASIRIDEGRAGQR